jgi:hypothetical protein
LDQGTLDALHVVYLVFLDLLKDVDVTVGARAHIKVVLLVMGDAVNETFLFQRDLNLLKGVHVIVVKFQILAKSLVRKDLFIFLRNDSLANNIRV